MELKATFTHYCTSEGFDCFINGLDDITIQYKQGNSIFNYDIDSEEFFLYCSYNIHGFDPKVVSRNEFTTSETLDYIGIEGKDLLDLFREFLKYEEYSENISGLEG